jgi:hypothetical protein
MNIIEKTIFQPGGDMILYHKDNIGYTLLWNSNTDDYSDHDVELVIQDDYNVVLYMDKTHKNALWSTRTYNSKCPEIELGKCTCIHYSWHSIKGCRGRGP